MSVQENGNAGQAPAAGTDQSGQAPTGQQGSESAQQAGQAPAGGYDLDSITDPALRAYVEAQMSETRRARGEAANYRTQNAEAQRQIQEYQRAGESAEQTAQREQAEAAERTAALERENRALRLEKALAGAATDAHNPAVVAAMIASQVQVDAEGKPTNVADLVAALKRSDPYLFRTTNGAADAGAGRAGGLPPAAGAAGSINDMIRTGGRGAAIR